MSFILYDRTLNLGGDWYLPEKPFRKNVPAVLLIHGGGWSAMDRFGVEGIAGYLCAEGFPVYNIEYRLTGTAPWPACGDDCLKAARFMLGKGNLPGADFDRLFVAGGSAGGHLSLMTGLRLPQTQVAGTVCISGITDLPHFREEEPSLYGLFGSRRVTDEMLSEASPVTYISEKQSPVLLTHCIRDTVVTYRQSELFYRASEKAGAQTEFFSYLRPADGHCIWIPGSKPHKLYPELESLISAFLKRLA